MKKWILAVLSVVVVALLLVGGYFALRYIWGIDLLDRSGWRLSEDTEAVYYQDYYGETVTGWYDLEGSRYYFDPLADGAMATGWLEYNGRNYYLNADGCLCSGWAEIDGGKYYLDPEGRNESGWEVLDGSDYYLDAYGKVHTGWLETDQGRYYLDADGHPVTGWTVIDDASFCFDDFGCMLTGWLEKEGNRYYSDEDGVHIGWLELSEGKYYFDHQGCLQTGWTEIDDLRYYFGEDGVMYTGWLTYDEETYYLKDSGEMAVGKVLIDGTYSFFASTGKQVIFVNRWNPVPDGFTPDLVSIEGFRIASECKDELQAMLNDCRAAGYYCVINTAYRNIAYQQLLWDNRYYDYIAQGYSPQKAADLSATRVLPPGTSEHHLGLAVDIVGSEGMYKWLEEHAPEYGFILRYPQDKIDETGVIYEPWHFRYLGRELAAELTSLGLTLDKYMEMLTESSQ